MDEKNKIARIIESESDGIKTKILEIEFPYENEIKALFTPKLENIGSETGKTRATCVISDCGEIVDK